MTKGMRFEPQTCNTVGLNLEGDGPVGAWNQAVRDPEIRIGYKVQFQGHIKEITQLLT